MLLLLALLLALVNPLVCVLHCRMLPATTSDGAFSPLEGFLCDLPEAHGTEGAGTPAPVPAPLPRAAYEATDTPGMPLAALVPVGFLILTALLLPATLATPPLLPPPRSAV